MYNSASNVKDLFSKEAALSLVKKENLLKIKSSAKDAFKSIKEIGKDAMKCEFHANKISDCSKKIFRLAMRVTPLLCVIGMVALVIATPYIGPGSLVGITALAAIAKFSMDHNAYLDKKEIANQIIDSRIGKFTREKDSKIVKLEGLVFDRTQKTRILMENKSSLMKMKAELKENQDQLAYVEANYNVSDEDRIVDDQIIEELKETIANIEKELKKQSGVVKNLEEEVEFLSLQIEEGSKKDSPLDIKPEFALKYREIDSKIKEMRSESKDISDMGEIRLYVEAKYDILKKDFEEQFNDPSNDQYKFLLVILNKQRTKEINAIASEIKQRQQLEATAELNTEKSRTEKVGENPIP